MTRLAGTTVYALVAALVLVAPLSASEEPAPGASPPMAGAPDDAVPAPPEAVPPEAPPPEAVAAPEPTVTAEPAPTAVPEPQPAPAPAAPANATPQPGEPEVEPREPPDRERPARRRAVRATAAADTSVTIRDFEFAQTSVTIDVGDTVTWSNEGPTSHSATAEDGSFDTGVFPQGQSRSHTFDQAGTFSYFCTPHPNMQASVTVRAASSGGGGSDGGGSGDGSGSSPGGDSGATGDGSGAALPATGLDAGGLGVLGLTTLALGAWLRRRAAAAG
jgi:plastocyanin